MGLTIAGIGTALPMHAIDQADAAEIARRFCCDGDPQRRTITELYGRSGVKRRHSVLLQSSNGPIEGRQSFFRPRATEHDGGPTTEERIQSYEQHAPQLALKAAHDALQDAALSPEAVTHLITVSCTGFSAPGFDLSLIRQLRLSPGVSRTHLGFMGCHGALNGLRIARAFAEAEPAACVLLCAVELCSLHHACGGSLDKIIANSLFADGAAAVVCRAAPTQGWNLVASGSAIIPDSEDAMSWRITNHGFAMTLSRRVPELIHRHLGRWMNWWLRQNQLSVDRIGCWAIHPGGPRILDAVSKALELDQTQLAESRAVLEELGNMSSPTTLFIMDRLRRRRAPLPCVALGFGPGMAVEAALITQV